MVLFLWLISLPLYLLKRREIFAFNSGLGKDSPDYSGDYLVTKKRSRSLLGLVLIALGAIGLLIIIAAIISMIFSEVVDAIVIISIVILNAIVGFVEEGKADKAIEALKNMTAPEANIILKSFI
jgi:magnesium-transporting ATPase (P-type)